MKPLHRLPLDAWFDDVPHPYDTWPMATDENPRPEEDIADEIARLYEEGDAVKEITPHEKAYRLAVEKHSPWKGGGSEEWLDSKPG